MKILFVCHGNICRSPMAEFVMKEKCRKANIAGEVEIESAALHTDEIGSDTHRLTRAQLTAHGIPFSPRHAWLLTREAAKKYDLIIGMDAMNMLDLRRLVAPEDAAKCRMLLEYASRPGEEIADPWYTGDYAATYRDVDEGCAALVEALKKLLAK